VSHSAQLENERMTTLTPESDAGVCVVCKPHLLVRCSHWLNVPILLGLILSGASIYWASHNYFRFANYTNKCVESPPNRSDPSL
jgi:hypothetical protein